MLRGSIGAVLFIRSQLLLPMISTRVSLVVFGLSVIPALVACSEDKDSPEQQHSTSSDDRVSDSDGSSSTAPARSSASSGESESTHGETSTSHDPRTSGATLDDSRETTTFEEPSSANTAGPDVETSGEETADVVTSGEQPSVDGSMTDVATSDVETTEPPRLFDYLPCDVEVIVAARCRVCHSRTSVGEEPLLDTYAQVRAEAPWVVEAVLEDFMPLLPPPLTDEEKATFVDWLESGTPAVRQSTPPRCSE